VRIFPNQESCLRLVRALAVEMHENWLEAKKHPRSYGLDLPRFRGEFRCWDHGI